MSPHAQHPKSRRRSYSMAHTEQQQPATAATASRSCLTPALALALAHSVSAGLLPPAPESSGSDTPTRAATAPENSGSNTPAESCPSMTDARDSCSSVLRGGGRPAGRPWAPARSFSCSCWGAGWARRRGRRWGWVGGTACSHSPAASRGCEVEFGESTRSPICKYIRYAGMANVKQY